MKVNKVDHICVAVKDLEAAPENLGTGIRQERA